MNGDKQLVFPELEEEFIIDVNTLGILSYTFNKNKFNIIENVRLLNNSSEKLMDLKITVDFQFDYISNFSKTIDIIESGESIDFVPEFDVSYRELFDLTETIIDNMTIIVSNNKDEIIKEKSFEFRLLPTNYWAGGLYPESIASFVMPNIPSVSNLLKRVSQILEETTGSSAITGYQSGDKNIVRQQLAAVYSAIYEQNIAYVEIPASFEVIGQRVRTPEEVLTHRIGNCIEMSVLYASLVEACGLHPLIIGVEGHAFVGVWLNEQTFDVNCISEFSELEKRIATGINDIEILEGTYLNGDSEKTFEQAVKKAEGNLEDMRFDFIIDVRRSHIFGIRPLPLKEVSNGDIKLVDYGILDNSVDKGVSKKTIEEYYLDTSVKQEVDKKEIWMRNMLDLSKKNQLISFKINARSIQIFNSDISKLEDALSDGEVFDIREKISDFDIKLTKNNVVDIESYKDVVDRISNTEFKSKRIRTFLDKEELVRTLKNIYKTTNLSIEETGASSLFLAMGFLSWIDPKDLKDNLGNIKPRIAPLILVPIDLIRKSNGSYQISIRDEDAQMNITLLEFLRQRFNLIISGLNPLPEDESGVNVPLVLNSIRKRIMNFKGWSVKELAVISNFSFSQFVMWNDLNTRFEKLTENKVVKGLVEGRYKDYSSDKLEIEELDNIDVSSLCVPTSVDSSQLLSILETAKGKSFVLHGPPGTGKSQTITNMISNSLAQGKSVLFVAEKMAALNVVYERLSKINLGDFCLELHSNKTQKSVVLEKFENNLLLKQEYNSNEYNRNAKKIQKVKSHLNSIIKELHKKRKNGFSIYELLSIYEKVSNAKERFKFKESQLEAIDKDDWEEILESILHIMSIEATLDYEIGEHPLRDFKKSNYELARKQEIINVLNDLKKILSENLGEIGEFEDLYVILGTEKEKFYNELVNLGNSYIKALTKEVLTEIMKEEFIDKIFSFIEKENNYKAKENNIFEKYTDEIKNVKLTEIKEDFLKAKEKIFFKNRNIKKALIPVNKYSRSGFTITKENINAEIEEIRNYQSISLSYEQELKELINEKLGITTVNTINEVYKLLSILIKYKNFSIDEVMECLELNLKYKTAGYDRINNIKNMLEVRLDKLKDLVGIDYQLNTKSNVEVFLNKVNEWLINIDEWKHWATFIDAIDALKDFGLENVVENLKMNIYSTEKNSKYDIQQLYEDYVKSIAKDFILYYIGKEKSLNSFSGVSINKKIKEYNEVVSKFEKLSELQIINNIKNNLPDARSCSDKEANEISNITRIIQSKGRGTSIRKLFKENGNVIKKLTPCMLMSPLSVAQYIDLDFPKFDVVIFDEASQIKTSTAVGAMSRAENCIIVGDPKQMPPTAFFSTKKEDEDNIHIEDLESLLEDSLAINMPERFLNCHYRSQSESLIAFSNKMYYRNKMITFPAPNDTVSKVKLSYISDGIYDRGNTRTNLVEAKAIVSEVIRRLKSKKLRKDSIGIVTFNSTQQSLIDDLLQEEFSKDNELENVVNKMHESIFIKNLENVQGDERDVILFSVTYGKDEDGKMYQNFGPLARKGGWRRLNVAVSRSRKEMIVFTSILPEDIKISKRTQDGVIGLKRFIEFANKGLSYFENESKEKYDNADEIINSVEKELNKQGYKTKINLGISEFNISLAIIDPNDPSKYICGILIDNSDFEKIETARDRYRLIPGVLENRGWKIYRLWSLDWFENKEKVLKNIFKYISQLSE